MEEVVEDTLKMLTNFYETYSNDQHENSKA